MPNDLTANINAVRRLLLKPLDQSPNLDTVLGAILDETIHLENELGNSSVAWNVQDYELILNGVDDAEVSGEDVGKILLVTAYGYGNTSDFGVNVEFTDLRDGGRDWWDFQPIASDRLEDFGYYGGVNSKIAFYRKDGTTYARTPGDYNGGRLVVKAAGNFSRDSSLSSAASMPSYHQLINVRAAQNMLAGAEWSDDMAKDEYRRKSLMQSLPRQEARYYEQFIIAKRSLTSDEAVFIDTDECY